MRYRPQIVAILLVSLFATACQQGSQKPTGNLNEEFERAQAEKETLAVPENMLEDIIPSIPSPIEMTALIKATGAEYSDKLLNPTSKAKNYIENHSKALNLGIYGADLAYMNIYEQSVETVDYLGTIRDLAEDFKIAEFFDFQTLKRIAADNGDIDSLILLSSEGFSKMNNFLDDNDRRNVSTLILTGTWLEGMHIATQVYEKNPNEELKERIGEQKFTLDNLLLLLSAHQSDPAVQSLLTKMEALRSVYNSVEISISESEPLAQEVDGMLIIEDQSMSEVKMTAEQLQKISEAIATIRNEIIA